MLVQKCCTWGAGVTDISGGDIRNTPVSLDTRLPSIPRYNDIYTGREFQIVATIQYNIMHVPYIMHTVCL